MVARRGLPRRAFLGHLGRHGAALAVFTPVILTACSDDTDAPSTTTTTSTSAPASTSTTTSTAPDEETSGPGSESDAGTAAADSPITWARTDLGFVSAYVLARGNRAAIVDTGVAGSAEAIGETLATLGLVYDDVDHVVLTHHHPDHVGSTGEVLAAAVGATAHAGEADLDEIALDAIEPVVGGEDVFGLEILATPGHTAGHISVIDHDSGLLVAGDALRTDDGLIVGPAPEVTADLDQAHDSVRRLAQLSINTVLVGHGDPIEASAGAALVDLAATL